MDEYSSGAGRRARRRAGMVTKMSSTEMIVPGTPAQGEGLDSGTPLRKEQQRACGSQGRMEVTVTRPAKDMEARASPRKPKERVEARGSSSNERSLLVA